MPRELGAQQQRASPPLATRLHHRLRRHRELITDSAEDALRVTRELIAIEEAGGGPAFDVDRHALQVSTAVRYLQEHLQRVLAGAANSVEHSAALMVVRAVRVAKARAGMGR